MHRVTSESKRGRQMVAATHGVPGNTPNHGRVGKPHKGAKQIAKELRRAVAARAPQ